MRESFPEWYGSWKSVSVRFCKWHNGSVMNRIFEVLSMDTDYEKLSLGSSSISDIVSIAAVAKELYGVTRPTVETYIKYLESANLIYISYPVQLKDLRS